MPGMHEMNTVPTETAFSAETTGSAETTTARAPQSVGVSKRAKTVFLLIPSIIVLTLLVAGAAFCGYAEKRAAIAPNTYVGSTDVGNLTAAEAAARIDTALDALRTGSGVRVTLEDGTEAAYLSYDELGARFDADALARDAYESTHSGNLIADGWALLSAMLGTRTDVTPLPVEGWTVDAARALAEAASTEPVDFSYEMDEEYHLYLTKERAGRSVDAAALRAMLVESTADETGSRTLALPYSEVPAKGGDLEAINEKYGGEMANARYDKETQTILPERMAVNFDVAEATRLLAAAEPGERVSVPTVVSAPEVTAEELSKVLFRDVLGTYTTRVGGAAGRKSNVRLTASRVNGAILNSGEDFNYYSYCGPFSASNGYKSAPGYLHGKTVEMDGGGACQCSSTTYAAALLANMQIIARTAHGFASDYIGLGLDATVSGGGPDFIFRNNTAYPIKVVTHYSDDNHLTVSIIGTKTDDTYVKMRTVELSSTPWQEEVIVDPSLAPGARVVDTTPYTGHVVDTYRQIYDGSGNLISETYEARSKYNKRNRIVKVGPAAETPLETPVETPVEQPVEQTTPAPAETPAVETPVVETPVVETPVVETPAEAEAAA